MMVCPVSRYTDSRKRRLVSGVGYTEEEKMLDCYYCGLSD